MKKILYVLCLSLILLSFGCANNDSENVASKGDVIELDQNSNNVEVSKEMDYLDKSSDIAETPVPFTQFKAFIPDEKNSDYLKVKDESVLYLKLSNITSSISGRLEFENNTENPMEIQTLFFQGNEVAKIKLVNESEYHNAIKYKVEPFSAVKIDIDIKVNKNGENELTFFPLDLTGLADFYNGANNGISRFYLDVNEENEENVSFEKHSFTLDQKEMENIENIFPIPYWVDENQENIREKYIDNKVFVEKKISGLKLVAIPYETEVDIILIDEFGNTSVLKEKVKVSKNRETYIPIESDVLKEIYNNKHKQFLIILNNRGDEIITDLRAIDMDKKPFPTTYNSIIQIYKNIDEEKFVNH